MKSEVAIATINGKAYFLLISELKERNINFLSIVPGDSVPLEAKAVITTEKERPLISHEKVLIYDETTDPVAVVNEAVKILQGKESYDKIVVGIDPGEVTGLATLADGKIIHTKVCLSMIEIQKEVKSTIDNVDLTVTKVAVKIGNGVPRYKELLANLNSNLPSEVILEVVSEAGTNKPYRMDKHRRGLRDISSAISIAGREGSIYPRGSVEDKEE